MVLSIRREGEREEEEGHEGGEREGGPEAG